MSRVETNNEASGEKILIQLCKKTGEPFRSLLIRKGTNLWVALRRFGVPVGASCSGVGVCGKCAVVVSQGTESALSEKTELEEQTITRQGLDPCARLSCLCRVNGELSVSADYW
ncbi:MAG: hypothetical protein RIR26_835 [Pseudomonadota bacterium]|jgi:2Fe-2S ferredoxin